MNRSTRKAPVIGLTGGLACGKSTVGHLLEQLGAVVLDTDTVAHELMRRGRPLFAKIVKRFGRGMVGADGEVDRRRLGRRVFASVRERRALEALAHPPVKAFLRRWLKQRTAEGRVAVVLVPLLYEAGWGGGPWDAVICVTASKRAAWARLRKRGLTPAEIKARWAAQWPPARKAKKADFVVNNSGNRARLNQQVRAIWKQLIEEER